ncbi:beta-propeller fold lactonase family protein, partial [Bacillus sp. D-CC]
MKMKDNKEFIGYVGTYTKENSEGIYKFTLDTEAKKISNVALAAKLDNPTYPINSLLSFIFITLSPYIF